jgi:hypothetical protein
MSISSPQRSSFRTAGSAGQGLSGVLAAETAQPAVQVEARGALIDLAAGQDAPVGELVGVLIAVVLLTVLFGSAAAMGATLVGA